MERQFFVYILTNGHHTTLYTGVTSDLPRHLHEHRSKAVPGFSARHRLDKPVFREAAPRAEIAIPQQKKIKGGSRASSGSA